MTEQYQLHTVLFPSPGPKNTEACLQAASDRGKTLGITKCVLASCSGDTAYKAQKIFDLQNIKLIVVTHVTGYRNPNEQRMPQEVRTDLESHGIQVITCAHAFGSIGRGIRSKLNTYQLDEIMAYTLRMFGHGLKVGVEISLMAADVGAVRTDEEVLAIGGKGSGADTATVLTPANSHNCLDLKVHEIITKPRL